MTYNSYSRENALANQYKFQGQEHQDELDLGWDSFKWRNHQPDIGRFFNVDPLAEKYVYNSPYAFSGNLVVNARELEGLEPAPVNKEEKKEEQGATGGTTTSTEGSSGPDAGVNENGEAYAHAAKLKFRAKSDEGETRIDGTILGGTAKGEAGFKNGGLTLEGEAHVTTVGVSVEQQVGSDQNNFTLGFSVNGPSADANAALTVNKDGVKIGAGAIAQKGKQTVSISLTIGGFQVGLTGTVLTGAVGKMFEAQVGQGGASMKFASANPLGGLGWGLSFRRK